MLIPRSLTPSSVLLLSLACAAGGPLGCAYDWTVGAPSAEGVDGGAPDATLEASTDATAPGDTSPGPGVDAAPDASDAGRCPSLEARLASARAAAKKCSSPTSGECATASITDECGCTSFVANGASAQTSAFVQVVGELSDAGCPTTCPDAGCSHQSIGSCLPNSTTYACYP